MIGVVLFLLKYKSCEFSVSNNWTCQLEPYSTDLYL